MYARCGLVIPSSVNGCAGEKPHKQPKGPSYKGCSVFSEGPAQSYAQRVGIVADLWVVWPWTFCHLVDWCVAKN